MAEEARRQVTPTDGCDEPVVGRQQLGQVGLERVPALDVLGAGGLAVAQVPPAVGRPGGGEALGKPGLALREGVDRAEDDLDGDHGGCVSHGAVLPRTSRGAGVAHAGGTLGSGHL